MPAAAGSTTYVTLEQCESLIATWMLEMRDSLQRDDFHVLMRAFQALDPDSRCVSVCGLQAWLIICRNRLVVVVVAANTVATASQAGGPLMCSAHARGSACTQPAVADPCATLGSKWPHTSIVYRD